MLQIAESSRKHCYHKGMTARTTLLQAGAVVASRQAAPSLVPPLQQQPPSSSAQQPQETAASVPATDARQPLVQWPAGMPTATQLMGSQADEPVHTMFSALFSSVAYLAKLQAVCIELIEGFKRRS